MDVFFNPVQKTHDPDRFSAPGAQRPIPEVAAARRSPSARGRSSGAGGENAARPWLAPLAAVHTPEYLEFLASIHDRWQADGRDHEVVPNLHPDGPDVSYPTSVEGQAGYHMFDTACPIAAETWDAVRASANSAVEAAVAVRDGARQAYALCRPPGHHASTYQAGGFCYLNNAAIAAAVLRERHDRVAILDVDLHHGNGTQSIFYARDDVLTVSIHADPSNFYPFFWGHAGERGTGAGLGYNLNLPLAVGSGDDVYMATLDRALARIDAFQPGALVVSLGLDASEHDPFGGLKVSTKGFARIGAAIGALGLPTALIQEGGYVGDALTENLVQALTGFMRQR